MGLFDTNGDGFVNFDEFLVGIRVSYTSGYPHKQLRPTESREIWKRKAPTYDFYI